MTNNHKTTRTGLAAIAAVLALTATNASAQDTATTAATGPIVLPEPAPAPVGAPAIVVPTAPVAIEAPQPQPAAVTARETVPKAAATARPRTVTASTPNRAAASRAPAAAAVAPATIAPSVAAPAAPLPADAASTEQVAPAASTPVATPRESADMTEALAKILAGLLVAGVAAFGIASVLRRRRRVDTMETAPMVIERDVAPVPVAAVEPAAMRTPEPAFAFADRPSLDIEGGLPNEGAAIALPREAPTDFEERTALLRKMVAARPDRANPFHAPAARLRRARLILASLDRKFEKRPPRIDLSQYTSNWPALRRWNRTAYA